MKKYGCTFKTGKFPQYQRTVYGTNEGLKSSKITALAFNKNGELYIGTAKGLCVLTKDNKIKNISLEKNSEITMLFCNENNHIFAGANQKLFEIDGTKIISSEKYDSDIVDMKTDEDETTWILTKDILFRKCKGSKSFDMEIGVPGEGTCIAVKKDNKVFMGTKETGFYALAGKRWHWSELMADLTGLLSDKIACADIDTAGNLWIGTDKGVNVYDNKSYWINSSNIYSLPDSSITGMVCDKNGVRYFSTTTGLVILKNGKLSYYSYKRWLPSPLATAVAVTDDGSKICVATDKGLSLITKTEMTLEEKAVYYRELAEKFNVRKDGFVLSRQLEHSGVVSENEGYVSVSDNDGLWTGLYLSALCYEYAVTKNPEVKKSARRSLNALIKLTEISGIEGFTARALRYSDEMNYRKENLEEWRISPSDSNCEWLGETSSDEMTGHFYAYSTYYDLVADDSEKKEIAAVVEKIMTHIINNNFRLIDIDGKPTTWANWDPNLLNNDQKWMFERGTNSLEIMSFLKTAEHMTGKKEYKEVFDKLLRDYHYGMNLMQYKIPDGHLLHIDDQLCFTAIVPLLKYTDDPGLRSIFTMGLTQHWQYEKSERNSTFNIVYGSLTGEYCELEKAIEELKEFPLDLVEWPVYNSYRKDIEWDMSPEALGMPPQLKEPVEYHSRRLANNDSNHFVCDSGCKDLFNEKESNKPSARPMFPGTDCSNGMSLDVGLNFMHPYWMARYYGMIEK